MSKNYARTIGVFFGSRSPEHDISIITATLVIKGLRQIGFNVVPVYVAQNGQWYLGDDFGELDFYKQANWPERLRKQKPWQLVLGGKDKLVFEQPGALAKKKITIDVAFPAFHGPNGEDGSFQGLCQMLNVPYVGCEVASSAITMDKVLTKDFLKVHEIPTKSYVFFSRHEWAEHKKMLLAAVESQLKFPLFVKPARGGSSIGISKVSDQESLEQALEVAFSFDEKVLVEEAVSNVVDLTVAVTGNYFSSEYLQVSQIQESRFSDDFFSYQDKYLNDGGAQLGNAQKNIVIPADIGKGLTEKIQAEARNVYTAFECTGIARVDFLLDKKTNEFFVNEINTLPGTLYHHLWKQSGVSLAELLRELIRLADERHEAAKSVLKNFDSKVLQHVSSGKLSSKI